MATTPTSTPKPKVNRIGLQVLDYRGGKTTTFGFLVGKVMKAASGKANPKRVNELLKRALDA